MKIIEQRDGQLAFDVGQAIIDERPVAPSARSTAAAAGAAARLASPDGCPVRPTRALLVEQGEARRQYAHAA